MCTPSSWARRSRGKTRSSEARGVGSTSRYDDNLNQWRTHMYRTAHTGIALVLLAASACSAPLSQVGQNPPPPNRPVPPVTRTPLPALGAPSAPSARAEMRDSSGQLVGSAVFEQTPHGVLLSLQLSALPPGAHGLHIHSVGVCEPPFASAGDHFAAAGRLHGFRSPAGPHAGDATNLDVNQGGSARADFMFPDVTLSPGPNSLFDADGSSLVVHANADDYTTDPSGNSGARIACGVIRTQ